MSVEESSKTQQESGDSVQAQPSSEVDSSRSSENSLADSSAAKKFKASPRLFEFHHDERSKPEDIPLSLLEECVRVSLECADDAFGSTNGSAEEFHKNSSYLLLYHCTVLIRKMLAVEIDPPIDNVIATKIPKFWVETIRRTCRLDNGGEEVTPSCPRKKSPLGQLQREMAWALTNIASGLEEHSEHILNIDGALAMMDLLRISDHIDVLDQACWAVGNLAGDGSKYRDYMLSLDAHKELIAILSTHAIDEQALVLKRNLIWALANLVRGRPAATVDHVTPVIPVFLKEIVAHFDQQMGDSDCASDGLWGLSYIAEGGPDRIAKILSHATFSISAFQRILVSGGDTNVLAPTVRFLGNIATGSDEQARLFFDNDFITPMASLLSHPKRGLRKETCWCLSNLAAGPLADLKFIMNSPGKVFEKLLDLSVNETASEVTKEAIWAVANATASADLEVAARFIKDYNFVEVTSEVISNRSDSRLIAVTLEAIDNIFSLAWRSQEDDHDPELFHEASVRLFDAGGLEYLSERLCSHNNSQVFERANKILEDYFDDFDTTQAKGIDRKWGKGKKKTGAEESDSDNDHNSDGDGYDL